MFTGHRLKGMRTFLPHSVAGLGAHLNDKEGSAEIRQGVTRVKCLGSIWSKCFARGLTILL